MTNLNFDNINNLKDLQALRTHMASSDGEDSALELKGLNRSKKLKKDQKKMLAREICAFANTYGGTIVVHFGEGDNLLKIPDNNIQSIYSTIEAWTRDALEPRLSGVRVKQVDGLLLIDAPHSMTKPHRTASMREYMYRHETQSEPMPEILVAALYRSQDQLNVTGTCNIRTEVDDSLIAMIRIKNNSMIAGTHPRLQLQIYSDTAGFFEAHHKHMNGFGGGGPFKSFSLSEGLFSNAMIETTDQFRERVLYPDDDISLLHIPLKRPNSKIPHGPMSRYILLRLDYFFLEAPRGTEFQVVDLKLPQSQNSLGKFAANESHLALAELQRLIIQDKKV